MLSRPRPVRRLALVATTAATPGQWLEPGSHPATYRSPSGGFSLFVDLSDRLGRGAAHHRMERGETALCTRQRFCALAEAVVTDGGERRMLQLPELVLHRYRLP